jgi:hypothetical protein
MTTFRDTRHLWTLLGLLAVAGLAGLMVRSLLVPRDFGEKGPYRTSALADNAALPSLFPADATCHSCHEDVQHERAGKSHEAVRCAHCHGYGTDHVRLAKAARNDPTATIPKAVAWDGDFLTKLDLYNTKDRRICVSCHQAAVGMPAGFKKINVAGHLEEQGASEPLSPETCFECHGGHDTAP